MKHNLLLSYTLVQGFQTTSASDNLFSTQMPTLKSADPQDYFDQCPKFICTDNKDQLQAEKESFSRYLSEQVFCFKSDFAEPLNVYLKDCNSNYGDREGAKMYCHG